MQLLMNSNDVRCAWFNLLLLRLDLRKVFQVCLLAQSIA